ncbi:hypothetical protein HYZ99_01345 [Candidatus Peregrinibacteria bacterium]|nr:hypothetical protein [Candidatus Peregrinibacteria bacterium]
MKEPVCSYKCLPNGAPQEIDPKNPDRPNTGHQTFSPPNQSRAAPKNPPANASPGKTGGFEGENGGGDFLTGWEDIPGIPAAPEPTWPGKEAFPPGEDPVFGSPAPERPTSAPKSPAPMTPSLLCSGDCSLATIFSPEPRTCEFCPLGNQFSR